jgi:ATP-dependent RNA helicase DDX54/DBP10
MYIYIIHPQLFVHRVGRAARQGRHGCAFSFVTQDELPFLVDVHLYLGRPLLVAGQATAEDSVGIAGKASAGKQAKLIKYTLNDMNPEQAHFGRFPQSVLDSENERLRRVLEDSSELQQVSMQWL